jgi:tetratricopeptide (TPR) repeat protein
VGHKGKKERQQPEKIHDLVAQLASHKTQGNPLALAAIHIAIAKAFQAHAEDGVQSAYADAEDHYQNAKRLQETALGEEHGMVLETVKDLIRLFKAQKKYSEAEQLLQHLYRITAGRYGEGSRVVARIRIDLSAVQVELGHYSEAENVFRDALRNLKPIKDERLPIAARVLRNLANTYIMQGKNRDAADLLWLVLRIWLSIRKKQMKAISEGRKNDQRSRSLDQPDLARKRHTAAAALKSEQYDRAVELFGELIDVASVRTPAEIMYAVEDFLRSGKTLEKRAKNLTKESSVENEDLTQELYSRIFAKRKWPRDVDLLAFLLVTMKGMATDERLKASHRPTPLSRPPASGVPNDPGVPDPRPSPEQAAIARSLLGKVEKHVKEHKDASRVLPLIDLPIKDACADANINLRQHNTGKTFIRRKAKFLFPEEFRAERDIVKIVFGTALLPLFNALDRSGRPTELIAALKTTAASLKLKLAHRIDSQLEPEAYVIKVKEVEADAGKVWPGRFMVMDPLGSEVQPWGPYVSEPIFGLPATWIDAALKEEAVIKGYTVIDAATVFARHLTAILKILYLITKRRAALHAEARLRTTTNMHQESCL